MIATADLMDNHPNLLVASPIFKDFGLKKKFQGKIRTIQCFEDNSLVRKILSTNGSKQVLVIDGGGSLKTALLGDQLALLAIQNHWQGIVIFGCIRDSEIINQLEIGVKAIATNPRKSAKNDQGKVDIGLEFAEVKFTPGQYLYADLDGIVLAKEQLH